MFFKHTLLRLRQKEPEGYQILIESWLVSADIQDQRLGLRGLIEMIGDENFHNFPFIFRLLTPYVRIAPPRLRSEILQVVSAAARRSPGEAAYFLRQNLSLPDSRDTAWVIRQTIKEFPENVREGLRAALRESYVKD